MARLTTLGVKFSYAVETVKGTKPTKFTQLEEASSIGGISLETEQIDVSALEDYLTQYVAGRQDTGGTWEIEFIMDPDKSVKQIKKLYEDSKAAKLQDWRLGSRYHFRICPTHSLLLQNAVAKFQCQKLHRTKQQPCLFLLSSIHIRDWIPKLSRQRLLNNM